MLFLDEPSQFSVVQTAQSLTCSIMEKPHTGLDDCLRNLLSCFIKWMSASLTTSPLPDDPLGVEFSLGSPLMEWSRSIRPSVRILTPVFAPLAVTNQAKDWRWRMMKLDSGNTVNLLYKWSYDTRTPLARMYLQGVQTEFYSGNSSILYAAW